MVFFSAGKGGGELVDYGYKGKGVTNHLLVDGEGSPIAIEVTSAKGDERLQVTSSNMQIILYEYMLGLVDWQWGVLIWK